MALHFIKRIFNLPPLKRPQREQEDLLSIAQGMEAIIDNLVNRIFAEHQTTLLTEDITFIVPAVWGTSKNGRLSPPQEAIHTNIVPALRKALNILDLSHLRPAQEFALGYIIRSLIVSKIVYMIEASKRRLTEKQVEEDEQRSSLHDIEPRGWA
jgi:hypothetical protein